LPNFISIGFEATELWAFLKKLPLQQEQQQQQEQDE